MIDLGLGHLPQKLPGERGQTLHVTPLPLGIENVESQGGLSRAAHPGNDDEAVARQFHVDVFEVVLPGPPNDDLFGGPGGLIQNLKDGRRDG